MKFQFILFVFLPCSLLAMDTEKQLDNYGGIVTATKGTTTYAPWRELYQQNHNRKVVTEKKQEQQPKKKDIFCRLIERDPKEDKNSLIVKRFKDNCVALSLQPYTPGHIMIIPIKHTGTLDGLSHDEYTELKCYEHALTYLFLQKFGFDAVNVGLNEGHNCGASIPDHLHVHLVPRFTSHAFTTQGLANPVKKNIHDTYALDYRSTQAKEQFSKLLHGMYDIIQKGISKITIPLLSKTMPQMKEKTCHICIQPSQLKKSILRSFKYCFVAFKNPNPEFLGHCIIAPHNHRKTLSELTSKEKKELDELTRKVNTAIKKALQPTGTNVGYTEIKTPQSNSHVCVEVLPRFPEFFGFIKTLAHTYVITENVNTVRSKIVTKLDKIISEKKE